MKRRVIVLVLVLVAVFAIVGALAYLTKSQIGDTSSVTVDIPRNSRYSEEQLGEAVELIKKEFHAYKDCKLLKLTLSAESEEGVVFLSDFQAGEHADGSLNKNQLYTDWQWHLDYQDGAWVIRDHGYG